MNKWSVWIKGIKINLIFSLKIFLRSDNISVETRIIVIFVKYITSFSSKNVLYTNKLMLMLFLTQFHILCYLYFHWKTIFVFPKNRSKNIENLDLKLIFCAVSRSNSNQIRMLKKEKFQNFFLKKNFIFCFYHHRPNLPNLPL